MSLIRQKGYYFDVLLQSFQNCRKIFIQRDYSEGTNVKFQTRFPAELQDKIEREQFEYTVKMMNTMYQEAGKANCATFCEGAMACMTAYLIHFCSETVSLNNLYTLLEFTI